jgi:hypothetical protein
MIRRIYKYKYCLNITVLTCLLLLAGTTFCAYSQSNTTPIDTLKNKKQSPVRPKPKVRFTTDTLELGDQPRIKGKTPIQFPDTLKLDTAKLMRKVFNPNPLRATWLAMVFPGAGQIYNRKYWKLPLVYGGLAGCAYALSWNNKMYKDYSQAYRDIMDDNPNTNSYKELLPAASSYSTSQLSSLLKRRKDLYRRYRDMSIFAVIGVYLLSIVDAYVDAELSNFDISPDLSMHVEPVIMNAQNHYTQNNKAVGVQCCLKF